MVKEDAVRTVRGRPARVRVHIRAHACLHVRHALPTGDVAEHDDIGRLKELRDALLILGPGLCPCGAWAAARVDDGVEWYAGVSSDAVSSESIGSK